MGDFFSSMVAVEETIQQSIISHLDALLNTRQGSLSHLPEYGLPAYPSLSKESQEKKQFIQILQSVIARFEPRIDALSIIEIEAIPVDCVLQIKLEATLFDKQLMVVNTSLLSGGQIIVRETDFD